MRICTTASLQCKKYMNKIRVMGTILCSSLLLSACGATKSVEEPLILVEPSEEETQYEMAIATVGDVVKTQKIRCNYRQLDSMDMAFPVSGKEIKEVHVKVGDTVKEGDLLAELDVGDVDGKIRELEYRIARNNLLLQYVDENENFEISSMWHTYIYHSAHSDEKAEAVADSVAALQKQNEYVREDYSDAIAMDTLELEQIQEEIAQSYLYAGMDGTVSYVKSNLVGEISEEEERVISIIDGSEGIFVVEDGKYADYFSEDVEVDMKILSGTAAGSYKVIPYKMEEWGEELFFTLTEDEENVAVKVGDMGTLEMIMGERKQVLHIPVTAVHTADGKEYVYVAGEGNIREVKWIETGLYGDNLVEVISGLNEGEKVIVR